MQKRVKKKNKYTRKQKIDMLQRLGAKILSGVIFIIVFYTPIFLAIGFVNWIERVIP